jgi:hypothetical protein
MDDNTLAALTVVNQRLAVLEANEVSANNVAAVTQIQANAAAVQSAEQLQEMQQQALIASQERAAAWAAASANRHPLPPGWRPGTPLPGH